MSYRPHFRGGRPQIRRSYSDGPWAPADHPEFVSGDSHFSAVRDANRGFRPNYNAVPPPPQYVNGPYFYGPGPGPNFYGSGSGHHRPGPPYVHQVHGPRPYMNPRPVGPAFGNYQPFRPQLRQQQYRPRATKPPDYREWEYAKPGVPPHCERFSVLSYNILADYLGTDHWHNLYFHIPHYIMDWNWRKRNIIFELGLWSADILCFQEVDRFPDIEAELRPRGYNGIWKVTWKFLFAVTLYGILSSHWRTVGYLILAAVNSYHILIWILIMTKSLSLYSHVNYTLKFVNSGC